MKASKYNRSQVMSRAWYIRKRSFNMTMSEALKESWKRIKEEVAMQEEAERRAAEYKAKHANRDYRNYRSYYGSAMGRNDWGRDYRNDIRTAVKRSMMF